MKATIMFLPPFLQPHKNVFAAIKNSTTTAANDSSDSTGGSCCHQREHKKYYYYEKHATRPAKQPPRGTEEEQQQQLAADTNACSARERRRSAQQRTILSCSSATSSVAQTTPATRLDTATTSDKFEYSKNSLQRHEPENDLTRRSAAAAAAVAARSVQREERAEDIIDPVRRTFLKTYARLADLADRIKLRYSTPPRTATRGVRRGTEECCEECSVSSYRLGYVAATSADDDENEAVTLRGRTSSTATVATQKTQETQTTKHISNYSQTTTLHCRCFKVNGDITATVAMVATASESAGMQENEPKHSAAKGEQHDGIEEAPKLVVAGSTSCRMSSAFLCCSGANDYADDDAEKFPRRTTATTKTTTLKMLLQLLLWLEMWSPSAALSWSQVAHTKMRKSATAAAAAVVSKWLFVLILLMLAASGDCWAGRQDAPTNCTFPARWEGSWFLSGYQNSIHIKGSQFSYRGKCAASDGNKYLIVDEKGCHRCLVIYEKHKNVLQYKESECEGDSMYMHQSNPSAMAMRSVLQKQTNSGDHRGGAHPNSNGHSRLSLSDQYIMRSNDDMNDCPPDFCKGRETLQNLCDQIPGDALLYSLFRESAEPVKCPLKGPFVFTYNRGHGECKSPVSNIESCTEDSRLLLSFQACPDVQGTESTVEELQCLATWKDGNSRYLVGLVTHHHAISNEERYRCFVYEKISSLMGGPSIVTSKDAEYKLAQSGDATCNGLDSAEVGSRIMSLRKPPLAERCDFPVWFKGPRHWHALMGNAVYNYHSNDGSVHIIKPNGYMETRALCEQINKQTSTEMMAVVHYTTGCQSGFMCMMFYRRDTHVIEIQTGKQASRLEDACAPDHFDINRMPYITLLASNPDPQICPLEGLYNLRGAIGPPYLTTRHKRNHNGKTHSGHGHHHHESGESDSHKRHSTLSLHDSDKDSWHANTRELPLRSRRDALPSSTVSPPKLTSSAAYPSKAGDANNSHANISAANTRDLHFNAATNAPVRQEDSVKSVAFTKGQPQRIRRDAPSCVTNFKAQRQLQVGCTEPNVIDVRPLCNEDGDEEYSCHGSWTENGTIYIIARHKGTKHGVCISYRPTEGTTAQLVVGDACYRGALNPPEHHLLANLSVFGKCGDEGSSATHTYTNNWFATLALIALTQLLLTTPLAQWQLYAGTGAFLHSHR